MNIVGLGALLFNKCPSGENDRCTDCKPFSGTHGVIVIVIERMISSAIGICKRGVGAMGYASCPILDVISSVWYNVPRVLFFVCCISYLVFWLVLVPSSNSSYVFVC